MLAVKKRGIAFFDCHIGYTVSHHANSNRYRRVKAHAENAIKAMLEFAEDFRPDIIINGGDALNCDPISHWNEKRAAETSRSNFIEEVRIAEDLLFSPIDALGCAEKIFITGNHEGWIDQLCQKYPQLSEKLSLEALLNLTERGYKVIPQGEMHCEGKLYFAHGDTIASGKYHSAAAVTDYMRNIVYGHRHTFQAFGRINPLDQKDTKVGWSIPGLCNLQPSYSKRQANQWMHGFCYFYILTDGSFSIYPVIMHKESFVHNDKLYGRR